MVDGVVPDLLTSWRRGLQPETEGLVLVLSSVWTFSKRNVTEHVKCIKLNSLPELCSKVKKKFEESEFEKQSEELQAAFGQV